MSPLDLQDLNIYLSMIVSPVIALQLLEILVARIRYGRYLHKNIHRIPLNFNDTSPIICTQEKGTFPIVSSIILLLVLLLPALTGNTANPIAYKETICLIAAIIIASAILLNLAMYRHCFSVLTENSLYTSEIRSLFRTVKIPMDKITSHELSVATCKGFFPQYTLIIKTQYAKHFISHVKNLECFTEAIDKLKAKSNSIQTPQDH